MKKNLYNDRLDGALAILLLCASVGFGIVPSLLMNVKEVFLSSMLLVTITGIYENVRLLKTDLNDQLLGLIQASTFILVCVIIGIIASFTFQFKGLALTIANLVILLLYSLAVISFRVSELKKIIQEESAKKKINP